MFRLFNKNITSKIILVLVFFTLSLLSSVRESLTFDEIVHIQEGENALLRHTFLIDTNNPPLIRELQTLPLVFHANTLFSSAQPNIQMLPARLVTIVLGIIFLLLVMQLTEEYFGFTASLFAGVLFTFEPTILGNSHYITQDIGISLLFFITYYFLLLLNKKFSYKKLFLFSLFGGLGMAAKITFIPYFLLTLLIFGVFTKKKDFFQILWQKRNSIICSLIIALFIVWTTYFFKTNVIVQNRQDTTRVSARLLTFAQKNNNSLLKNILYFSEHQQLPLGDYIGTIKNNALRSTKPSTCFFLGSITQCRWYYMLLTLFLKLPLPLLVFFGTSLILSLKESKKRKEIVFLLIPLTSVLMASMLLQMTPWVRYILPLYPFLIITSAAYLSFWTKTTFRKILFAVLVVVYIADTLISFPHFLSFANELTFGQKYFLFTDSNLDWGQSLEDVKKYVNKTNNTIEFSYFGRDNADLYGLKSNLPYGSYKNNEICAFHRISRNTKQITNLISISNWQYCGYNTSHQFNRQKIKEIIGESVFVF